MLGDRIRADLFTTCETEDYFGRRFENDKETALEIVRILNLWIWRGVWDVQALLDDSCSG